MFEDQVPAGAPRRTVTHTGVPESGGTPPACLNKGARSRRYRTQIRAVGNSMEAVSSAQTGMVEPSCCAAPAEVHHMVGATAATALL